eukprot:PLAT8379.2.p2 GENE.PLAT8379.2~~PLAT8379.2.p2  ORF type:complete len:519 (-),score=260.28 PLAT8379.2:58-1590(-)
MAEEIRKTASGAIIPSEESDQTPFESLDFALYHNRDVKVVAYKLHRFLDGEKAYAPDGTHLTIRDLSVKHPDDARYERVGRLQKMVRRGNTIMTWGRLPEAEAEAEAAAEAEAEAKAAEGGRRGEKKAVLRTSLGPRYKFARRGLPKFFDLYELPAELAEADELCSWSLTKANGENCQLAWDSLTEQWVAASKNVAVLFSCEEDLRLYSDQRYSWATDIGRLWLEMLADRSEEEMAAIRAAMRDVTFVGEVVGVDERQHLVRYDTREILFYAVCPHDLEAPCLPPPDAMAIFDDLRLPRVDCMERGRLTPGEFKEYVESKKRETLEAGGEGDVIYFAVKEGDSWVVRLLGKVKVIAYRFFRKLREKGKSTARDVGKGMHPAAAVDKHWGRMQREMTKLCDGEEMDSIKDEAWFAKKFLLYVAFCRLEIDFISNRFLTLVDRVRAASDDREDWGAPDPGPRPAAGAPGGEDGEPAAAGGGGGGAGKKKGKKKKRRGRGGRRRGKKKGAVSE